MEEDEKGFVVARGIAARSCAPFCSFDVRGRDSSSDGKHWSAKEPFGSRAFFRVTSDPTFLLINDVRREVRRCLIIIF